MLKRGDYGIYKYMWTNNNLPSTDIIRDIIQWATDCGMQCTITQDVSYFKNLEDLSMYLLRVGITVKHPFLKYTIVVKDKNVDNAKRWCKDNIGNASGTTWRSFVKYQDDGDGEDFAWILGEYFLVGSQEHAVMLSLQFS